MKLGPARQAVAEAPGAGPISPRGADGHSVVLAFVRLKQASVLHADLATQLDELEQKAEALLLNHLSFTRNTRNRVKHAFDALRELITPLDPAQRPIGFVTQDDTRRKKIAPHPDTLS